ncbi:MAG: nitrogen fixation protein NifZ [Alphaproteobacteria bacterium]|nr:nitrogen fixation protein NifZ [Alphaproteobacteria bacterium]
MPEPKEDEIVEIDFAPAFKEGQKVRSMALVRNDGTYPNAAVGDVLIKPGAIGYVHHIGTFLARYYIYAVEFVVEGRLVGMRARELELVEEK